MIIRRPKALPREAVSRAPRKRGERGWRRPAVLACCAALLGALAGPHDALAAAITIDTSSLAGISGQLDIDLYDKDLAANNSVTISNIVSNGTSGQTTCSVGCTGGPASFVLDDALGFGQLLYDLTFGTSLSFELSYTNNFAGTAGVDTPDQIVLNLLDPGSGFALAHTNLTSFSDALLTVDLTGSGSGLVQAASSSDPSIGVTVVPEPDSLALAALALLALVGGRARAASRTSVSG